MPWTVQKDGDQYCVIKKDTGERVPGGCHPTQAEAENHMRAILANYHAGGKAWWVTWEEMQELCPDCADNMKAMGLDRLNITGLKQMPAAMLEGLCSKFGGADGFRTRCMDSSIPIDNKGAFCNWLKNECHQTWGRGKSSAAKAGARHSTSDIAKGRGVKQKAREIVKDMEDLGFPDEQQVGNPGEVPAAKADAIPESGEMPVIFGAVKAAGDWELDVLYLPYGGPKDGKDAQGEYFSAKTNEHADKFPNPAIFYYHGYTPDGKPQGAPEVIGKALKRWADQADRKSVV